MSLDAVTSLTELPRCLCEPTGGADCVMPTISSPLETVAGRTAHQNPTNLTIPQKARRRALVVPREHGAWGMLLVPLVTGAAVGLLDGGRLAPVLLLLLAVLALFWLRTPVESWLGTNGIRAQT